MEGVVGGVGYCRRCVRGVRVVRFRCFCRVAWLLWLRLGPVLEERRREVLGFVFLMHTIVQLECVSSASHISYVTHLESFPVQSHAISQIALSFTLYSFLIMV